MARWIIVLLSIALWATGVRAETVTYRETAGGRTETHTYTITPRAGGFEVLLVRRGDRTESVDWCQTGPSLETLRWRHENAAEKTVVVAEREGKRIRLSGTHEGKAITRVFEIDASPWKQLFSIDFASFAALGKAQGQFWSIGTAGVADMKVAAFSAEIAERREIPVNGRPVAALLLRVRPTGMRSLFWHGDYWLRASDGRYLKYVGKRGLFAGDLVKELVSEE